MQCERLELAFSFVDAVTLLSFAMFNASRTAAMPGTDGSYGIKFSV